MARILTGIQSTSIPHLGNILGAIQPAVELSNQPDNDAFLFIADLHSLTSVKDSKTRQQYTYAVAATWLAFGLDTDKNTFYRQSDVPEVCELAWYLSCFTPYPMLANAHSFKDKAGRLSEVNAGLFTYPVLMAADILLYDAEFVPVGKDQQQHLEMARDMAGAFNHIYGDTFVVPDIKLEEYAMTVPGTDGQKMSSSYHNFIDIFLPEKELRKQVMGIVTDSKQLEEPKDPDNCTVFKLYALLAEEANTKEMRSNYTDGGYGYGHAKQALFELLMERFSDERAAYRNYMDKPTELDAELLKGAEKARAVAREVLARVRSKLFEN